MKRFNLHIGAFLTLALAVSSCAEEELVKDYFVPSPSNTITFGASDLQVEVLSRSGKSENAILSTTESKLVSEDGKYSLPMLVQVQEGIHRIGEDAPASRGNKMTAIGDIETLHAWAIYDETTPYINGTEGDVFAENGGIYSPATQGIHYMWPSNGTLDFMTVANKPDTFTPNFNDANTEIVSFDYTVPANADGQPDILIAQASASADAGEGENPFGVSVPLDFKHIMAAVNFKVGTIEHVTGEIQSITLKGVYNQGTYNVNNNEWANLSINDGGTFSVPLNDAKTASATTLMMIPQQPFTGAEVEIVFDDEKVGAQTLRASIQGDSWTKNTTTNYLINIDGSYNIQIVPLDKVIDSHYVITKVEVTSQNPWNLNAVSSDGALVTVQLESEVNSLAKKGFWTDKKVTKNGNQYTIVENTTARGDYTLENAPAGTHVVYVFIPENISGEDRTITLTATDTQNVSKELELIQSSVKWLDSGSDGYWGCELLIETQPVDWGFCWDGLNATFVVKQGGGENSYNPDTDTYDKVNIPKGQDDKIKPAMELAGINVALLQDPTYYINVAKGQTQSDFYIKIDLGRIGNIGIAEYGDDGWQNTYDIYHFEGISALSQLIDFCNSWGDITNPDGRATKLQNSLDYAAMYAMKRNRFYYYEQNIEGTTMTNPVIFENDLLWYLPAKDQFKTLIKSNWGQDFNWSDSYWTSTAYLLDEADNSKSYAYINGVETIAYRKDKYLAMALRTPYGVTINPNDVIQSGTGNTNQQ